MRAPWERRAHRGHWVHVFALAVSTVGCGGAPEPTCPRLRVEVAVRGNHALDGGALAPIVHPLETVRSGPLAYYDLFEDRLETATRRLQTAYHDRGYVDAIVHEPSVELSHDRAILRITLRVVSGPRYRIGAIRIVEVDHDGASRRDASHPRPVPETPRGVRGAREGAWFWRRRVAAGIQEIRELYEEHGYAFVRIERQTELRTDPPRVDLVLRVRRGRACVVDMVEVLDEIEGPRAERTGISIGERFTLSRVRRARRVLEARHVDREVRFHVLPRPDAPGRALLRFVMLERR